MSPSEIQACLERANAVINGFKRPSERNARDVVALLKWFNGRKVESEKSDMPDFLKDLFKL